MCLEFARNKLNDTLREVDLATLGSEIDKAYVQIIDDWFTELKKWESSDSFATAFKDNRMTARVVDKGPVTHQLSMNQYNLQSGTMTAKITTSDPYNTGMSGMKLRSNPGNFEEFADKGGMRKVDGRVQYVKPVVRGKYNLGLHDLSVVLLSPDRGRILNQLAWKEGAKNSAVNAVAFMPLPQQEDMRVFTVLSAKAKMYRTQHALIHAKVVDIRRKMTRVKLANEEDAGSGFVNVGTGWQAKERKYRYGLGLIAIKGKTGKTGPDEMERRRKLAVEYKTMLSLMKPLPSDPTLNPTHNEVVLAYRQHESMCFPLFADYDKDNDCWRVFDGPEGFQAEWIGSDVPKLIHQDGTWE